MLQQQQQKEREEPVQLGVMLKGVTCFAPWNMFGILGVAMSVMLALCAMCLPDLTTDPFLGG